MKKIQIVKSAQFGEVYCDFYGDGNNDFYMTREQIGAALEYIDPIRAISKVHERKQARLDKHSTVVKLTTVDGKKRDVTVYNRKGIMEICRHSDQPKADAFMDWVWEVMDSLISGKNVLLPRRSMGEVNSAARIIAQTLKDAGVSPQFRAVAIKSLYAPIGVEIPLTGITTDKMMYDCTMIAEKLGITSKSGNPHNQVVAVIISKMNIADDEKEPVPFQNKASGHSGTNWQYSESVIAKVDNWLKAKGYPAEIVHGDRRYKVYYKQLVTA